MSVDSVPFPDRGVITNRDENSPVCRPGCLSHMTDTFAVIEGHRSDVVGFLHVQVPDKGLPSLVTESQQSLTRVQAEPHEPDLAVLHLQFVNYRRLILGEFFIDSVSLQAPRLPADNFILTGFGEDEVSEPATTVDIIPVDISG